jgi:hypothetical protein
MRRKHPELYKPLFIVIILRDVSVIYVSPVSYPWIFSNLVAIVEVRYLGEP